MGLFAGWGVNLVEDAAVGEVRFLRFLPAAENLVDGNEFEFREAGDVGGVGLFGVTGTVVVFGGEFLAGGGLEVVEISAGQCFGAMFLCYGVDDGDRRFGEEGE